jgi:hypothetical protein
MPKEPVYRKKFAEEPNLYQEITSTDWSIAREPN